MHVGVGPKLGLGFDGDTMTEAGYDWMSRYNDIVPHFHEESDRAAALLAASFAEAAMRAELSKFLADDRSTAELFRTYRPLGEFSGLIDMSFCLGFLTREMKVDLTMVRRIRNHFAHHPEHVTFAVSPISDYCRELSTSKGIQTADGGLWRREQPRDQFLFAIAITLTYFERFVRASARREIPAVPLAF